MADVDDDRGRARLRVLAARLREGPQQAEGLEVDAGELDPRLAASGDVAIDQVAVGDDEQDAATVWPVASTRSLSTR